MKELIQCLFIYAGALAFGLMAIAVFLGKIAETAKNKRIEIERGRE